LTTSKHYYGHFNAFQYHEWALTRLFLLGIFMFYSGRIAPILTRHPAKTVCSSFHSWSF